MASTAATLTHPARQSGNAANLRHAIAVSNRSHELAAALKASAGTYNRAALEALRELTLALIEADIPGTEEGLENVDHELAQAVYGQPDEDLVRPELECAA